ncbi:filamentous hemagglutinin N-terminal domain-containing protein [Leptolyngbya sp. AN03gr2]|uniref:two-partner secretion domain-containing protein n=1 Tax=unclassified Leptolyngbya TaxID=2650499 RepID=UPI003D31499C
MIHRNLLAWCLGISGLLMASPAIAQLVPDSSLGSESSIVTPGTVNALPAEVISGGAQRGTLLFHSFRDFNVGDGGRVYFGNPTGVGNIFTRVTGTTPSNIFGTLGVNGGASLFLLNPNGILFGTNARLDIRGSFVASSSDRLIFNDGFAYSASTPQAPPLLTISTPIGLQYGNRAGEVRSQGAILQVQNGQTLALVGGNVAIEGGQLLAPGGRIALGGISEAGTIGLNSDGSLNFPDSLVRSDTVLTNGALVDVTAGGGGEIAIAARNLEMSEGSRLRAGIGAGLGSAQAQAGKITIQAAENAAFQNSFIENLVADNSIGNGGDIEIDARSLFLNNSPISASTLSEGASGNLTVKATESVQVIGILSSDDEFPGGLSTRTRSRGNAGNVSIETRNLIVRDGAVISSSTFGEGAGGNLTMKATESVQVIGESADGQIGSGFFALIRSFSDGDSGNISIETGTLIVRDGAQISTANFGEGAGGNLTVKATELIQLIGESPTGPFPSGLFTQTQDRGSAGNLIIETENFIVRDGAQVSSGTRGEGAGGNLTVKATESVQLIGGSPVDQAPSALFSRTESRGNAGNISIETGTLIVRDGAQASSGTRGGSGAGGNLTVSAANLIQVIGTSSDGQFPSRLTARTTASGNAGDIALKTRHLIIENGGDVSSQQTTATATGNVGNIRIQAESLSVGNNATLTVADSRTIVAPQRTASVGNINVQTNTLKVDRGIISAATASTDGGNIGLDVQDVLLLRNGGRISTDAGTAQAGGNGGNITLNSNFIVAVPEENSIISANAFTGRGGNIRITTQGLFGIEPRSSATTGLSSITASSQFGISGTITLNTPDVDPSQGLVQLPTELQDTSGLIASTCPADEGNSFAITGRGGIPEDPRQPLMSDRVWLDDRASTQTSTPSPQPTIVEAQGWVRDRNGTIALVATYPSGTTQAIHSPFCAVRSR